MLRAFEIENFKAFGKRQRIEFAPITLIFGENSAGKSSVLQALSLLKQSRRHGDDNTFLLPRVENGYVDLGSFEELIFDHDLKSTLRFRLEFDHIGKAVDRCDTGVELSFFRRSARSAIELADWSLYEGARNKLQKVASFAPLRKSQVTRKFHGSSRTESDRIRKGECTWINERREFWEAVLHHVRHSGIVKTVRTDIDSEVMAEQELLAEMRHLQKHLQEMSQHLASLDNSLEQVNDQLNELNYLTDQKLAVHAAEVQSLTATREELMRELERLQLDMQSTERNLIRLKEENAFQNLTSELDRAVKHDIRQHAESEEWLGLVSKHEHARRRIDEIEFMIRRQHEDHVRIERFGEQKLELTLRRETISKERAAVSDELENCVWQLEQKEREYDALRESRNISRQSGPGEQLRHRERLSNPGAFSEMASSEFVAEVVQRQLGEILNFRGFAITGREKDFRIRGVSLAESGGDILDKAIAGSSGLERLLRSLCPMGPFRRPPERWYVASGQSSDNVGYGGARVPEFLFANKDLLEKTNEWLDRLLIGYHIKPRRLGVRQQDLFELRLIDNRRSNRTEVAIADVGFGISQILPFIVQCLVDDNQVITIEQPEVHIHPRLQADIGDLLAEAVTQPNSNQFIVETHSEHLVLRLQNLVRKGKLAADDVAIIYVRRGEDGAQAERLRLDGDGDFIDEWPGGFFPERMRELR